MRNKHTQQLTTRAWQSRTLNVDARTMQVVAATETPARVMDWASGNFIDEVLLASGFKSAKQVPLLDSHNRSSIQAVIGSATGFTATNGSVVADVRFAETEDGERAMRLYEQGHLTDVSVGYTLDDVVEIEDGKKKSIGGREFVGPVRVVKRWSIKELSAVPIGADPQAKARAEDEQPVNDPAAEPRAELETKQEETRMEPTPNTPVPAPVSAPPQVDIDGVKRDAIAAERKRAAEIKARAALVGCDDVADDLINRGLSIEDANVALLDEVGKRAARTNVQTRIEGGPTDGEKFRAAAADALLMRYVAGHGIKSPAAGASEMRSVTFSALATECVRRMGVNPAWMSREEMFKTALGRRSGVIPLVTGDFDAVLANVASKAMGIGFNNSPQTFRAWCRIGSLPNFLAAKRVILSDAPVPLQVNEAGEVKFGKMSDIGENITLVTYARRLGLTRPALINDDMGAFNTIFRAFGARYGALVNSLPYAVLIANAALSDTGTLFNTTAVTTTGGHANQAAAGGAPSSTTVSTAEAAMIEQVGPEGIKLNIRPKFIMTGSANKVNSEIVANSAALPVTEMSSGTYNPYYNVLSPICDANITGTKWYLAASPDQADTIEVAFLDGNEAPTLEERVSSDILGTEYWCYGDATAKALDFRGLYYNAGA